jgi:hypothetical protein
MLRAVTRVSQVLLKLLVDWMLWNLRLSRSRLGGLCGRFNSSICSSGSGIDIAPVSCTMADAIDDIPLYLLINLNEYPLPEAMVSPFNKED